MTKQDLIHRYMKSIGRHIVQGSSAEPLLPFLLGDAIYTIYTRDIAPLDLRHREKVIRNHWQRSYSLFNKPFFQAIGVGGYDQVYDLMDDFEQAININLLQLRSELMLLMQEIPFERRGVIVSALLCHVLAQAAQCAWGNVYQVEKVIGRRGNRNMIVRRPEVNTHLAAIGDDAFNLANIWHSAICDSLRDPNKTKGIPLAVKALCRKIYAWVEKDAKKEN